MEKTTTAIAACGGGGDDDPIVLLPEDSLIQILLWLPVISLLRFKAVCKSWRDLIQTSFFIHLHSTFNSSSNFGTFILITDNHPTENEILMLSEYEEGSEYGDGYRCSDGSWHKLDGIWDRFIGWDKFTGLFEVDDDADELLLKVDNFEIRSFYKLTSSEYNIVIAGSCNGLVCLYDQKLRDVSLWNPATRQRRTLPKSITIEIDDDDLVRYGMDFVAFGFDVKTKDYKVLLIPQFRSKNRAQLWQPKVFCGVQLLQPKVFCGVQVYSLSTDSWRLVEGGINSPLALPETEHNGLYLNGSCFFIASVYHPETNSTDSHRWFINSFDFTKEIFTTIQLPPDHHDHRQNFFLRCLGGETMALFTTLRKRPSDEYEDFDIWVLNEQHGGCGGGGVNKESWTKLHSFQTKNNRKCEPIGISNNGKFAILDTIGLAFDWKMQLYNLVTKEVKLDIPFGVSISKVYVYKPSLVSISSPAIG